MQSFHDTMTAFADRMHPVARSADMGMAPKVMPTAPRSADMGMAPRTMPMAPRPAAMNAFAMRGGRSILPTRGLL